VPGAAGAGWGSRWLAAVERLFDAGRFRQARWHAKAGRVVRLEVAPGIAVARLEGGLAMPRNVVLRPRRIGERAWRTAIAHVAAQALAVGQALAGELPEAFEAGLAAAGESLFPREIGDLGATCSCSEARRRGELCKHAGAVCVIIAERMDTDPELLLHLRGSSLQALVAALRERRPASSAVRADDAGDFFAAPGGPAALAALEALAASGSPSAPEESAPQA
jgi:uncharacterized Zn finger protein